MYDSLKSKVLPTQNKEVYKTYLDNIMKRVKAF